MTASAILVPGALIILFVVAWMLFGLIDSAREDKKIRDAFLAQSPHGRVVGRRRQLADAD